MHETACGSDEADAEAEDAGGLQMTRQPAAS